MDACEVDKNVIQDLLETPVSRSVAEELKILEGGRLFILFSSFHGVTAPPPPH